MSSETGSIALWTANLLLVKELVQNGDGALWLIDGGRVASGRLARA
jgi:hypothetical protein